MEAWLVDMRNENSVLKDLAREDDVAPCPLTHTGKTLLEPSDECAALMMKMSLSHMSQSFRRELLDVVTLPACMSLTHDYEDGYMLQLARMLDAGLCVPSKTSTFELSNGQRMQAAHLACILAARQQEKVLRATYFGDKDTIDTSLGIRSDGGLQRLQVFVAPPGSGKTVVVAAVVATRLCRRNWEAFVQQVRDDQLRAPSIELSHAVPLKPIAVVVCPPGLVQQWLREATALLHGPDCRPGAAFEAGSAGAEWRILTSHKFEDTRELLKDAAAVTSPQLWIIASENGPFKPYSPLLANTSVGIAMAIYDECTYTFAKEPHAGSGYSVPMSIFVTASAKDIVDATRNTQRHPLRVALAHVGACTNTDFLLNRWSDPNHPKRVSVIASLLFLSRVPAALSKIRLTMAMRLFIGPPELPLLQDLEFRALTSCKQFVLFSLPCLNSAVARDHAVDGNGVRVGSLASNLRRQFRYIRARTLYFKPKYSNQIDLYGDAVGRLQAAEAAGACLAYEETLENLRGMQKAAGIWYNRRIVAMRMILTNAEGLAAGKLSNCPVCFEAVDANQPGGPTTCCGQIMCIPCAKRLQPANCPFCRTEASATGFNGEFGIVQAVGAVPTDPLTQLLSKLPQSPVEAGDGGDEVLFAACSEIHQSRVDLHDAFSSALRLALMARAGTTPRVLVFFGFVDKDDRLHCKIRIKEIARDADIRDIEGIAEKDCGTTSAMVARAIPAFVDPACTKPVILLCDMDHTSHSIAGADLGVATAVIVAGSLHHGAATQLLGRITRRSQLRDAPSFRVFFVHMSP